MQARTDFIVRSADNQPQLAVEVKTRRHVDPNWATSLRRNLLAHSQIPATRFFLLALPERFFLWKDAPQETSPPQYTLDAKEVLGPYLQKLPFSLDELSEQSFEVLIRNWLEDVTSGGDRQNWSSSGATAQLVQSGLYEAIKDGSVDSQVAA